MSALLFAVVLVSAGTVLVRCICVAAALNSHAWPGHPFRFFGIAAGYALAGGGATGIVLGWHHAPHLLLIGAACWVGFERRRPPC